MVCDAGNFVRVTRSIQDHDNDTREVYAHVASKEFVECFLILFLFTKMLYIIYIV